MNTTKQEKSIKQLFMGKCWAYLSDNFHKFTQDNKIKIALTLAGKDTPQEIQGLNQQIVVMNDLKKEDNRLSPFVIGLPVESPENGESS